jgi:hypothetical protein
MYWEDWTRRLRISLEGAEVERNQDILDFVEVADICLLHIRNMAKVFL